MWVWASVQKQWRRTSRISICTERKANSRRILQHTHTYIHDHTNAHINSTTSVVARFNAGGWKATRLAYIFIAPTWPQQTTFYARSLPLMPCDANAKRSVVRAYRTVSRWFVLKARARCASADAGAHTRYMWLWGDVFASFMGRTGWQDVYRIIYHIVPYNNNIFVPGTCSAPYAWSTQRGI